jgi:outer membrane receptor protein involved in Fe transport
MGTRFARVIATDSLGLPIANTFKALELKPYVDANLGIEYRYNKVLSAFLNVNNIAARRYERYYGFPSQRINFILAISYSL